MNDFENDLASSIAQIIDEETQDAKLYMNAHNNDELDDDDEDDVLSKKSSGNNKNKKIVTTVCITMVAVVLITVVIAIMLIIKNNTHNSFSYNYKTAKELYNQEKYDEAVIYFEKALSGANSGDITTITEINMYMYDCYAATGKSYGQIEALNNILAIDKYNEEAISALAKNYYNTGNGTELNRLIESYKNSKSYELLKDYIVAKPVSNINSGKYENNIMVELSADTESTIYYTLDGSNPTVYANKYAESFEVGSGVTELKMIAINSIGVKSEIVTYNYEITYNKPAKPILSAISGTYSENTLISINNLPDGAEAYYTWDGTTPTKESSKYDPERKIEMIPGNNVLSVIIYSKYDQASSVSTYIYNLTLASKYEYAQCLDKLIEKLTATGVLKTGTTLAGGEECRFVYYSVVKIEDKYIYVVYFDIVRDGNYERQEYQYGIDSNTGDTYKVTKNGTAYELQPL